MLVWHMLEKRAVEPDQIESEPVLRPSQKQNQLGTSMHISFVIGAFRFSQGQGKTSACHALLCLA